MAVENAVLTFTVIPPPVITSFTPASGPVGTVITVTGSGFTGTTAASVDSVPASFTVVNDTTENVTVPSSASTGPIHIRTAGGLGASATNFVVAPLPTVTSFTPTYGPVGTSVTERLLAISATSYDRLLARARTKHPHGFCTTKPAPHMLLRSQVPVRMFSGWNEAIPGFLEVDLVAHCGDSARGSFLFTLTGVDVKTGWTRCLPLPSKSMIEVTKAMEILRKALPFPLLGIDTDNGGEFINRNLVSYCADNKITMTRCRPYKKNDQCHVEQKNGNVVRVMAG